MPDEDKATNTNQPITGGTPIVGQSATTTAPTTPVSSPTATPFDISGQAIDTPPPPMEDGAVSPPPPMVEEKKPEETTTPAQVTGATEGTQTIPDIPPVITTSDTGGKKPVGKRMIATILGVLVLVGGIGAGVILVQNQQDIREEAYIPYSESLKDNGERCSYDAECKSGNCVTTPYGKYCVAVSVPELSDYEQCIADGNTPTECSGTSDSDDENDTSTSQCFTQTPSIHIGDYGYCGWPVCIGLVDGKPVCSSGCTCPQSAPSCTGDEVPGTAGTSFASKFCVGSYVYDDPGDDNSDDSDDSETTASCLDISVFDIEWSPITNLSSLVAGDVVRFTVAGTTNSGSFDKARFTINGVLRTEVTTKRPSTNEFYDEYTIPEDITTFTINAEIHHTTLGWF